MSPHRNHGLHRIFGSFFLISFAVASRKRYNSRVEDEGAVVVGNSPLAAQDEPQLSCPVLSPASRLCPPTALFSRLTVLLGHFRTHRHRAGTRNVFRFGKWRH